MGKTINFGLCILFSKFYKWPIFGKAQNVKMSVSLTSFASDLLPFYVIPLLHYSGSTYRTFRCRWCRDGGQIVRLKGKRWVNFNFFLNSLLPAQSACNKWRGRWWWTFRQAAPRRYLCREKIKFWSIISSAFLPSLSPPRKFSVGGVDGVRIPPYSPHIFVRAVANFDFEKWKWLKSFDLRDFWNSAWKFFRLINFYKNFEYFSAKLQIFLAKLLIIKKLFSKYSK